MNPQNRHIVDAFNEIADLLELKSADPVRIRAYRKACAVVAGMPNSVRSLLRGGSGRVELPGIGEGLTSAMGEIAETGSCAVLERLHADIPQDLSALLGLAHLGPQRVRTLHEELGVKTLKQLHDVARTGRLQALAGFGPRLEQQILKATTERLLRVRKFRLDAVSEVAQRLRAWVGARPDVARVEFAGSLRRASDSVSNIDLIAESEHDRAVVEAFANHPDAAQVPFAGRARIGLVLASGLEVNLQVASGARFGAAWLTGTGSRAHVGALQRLAHKQRMALDENGLTRAGKLVAAADEDSIYHGLALAWVPPELREGDGELAAAGRGTLPRLIEHADLRGDLQVQTRDGGTEQDLPSLAREARARGLAYIAVADHARRINLDRVNDLERLTRQIELIDRLNADDDGFTILKAVHVDILEDGRLNVPDSVLCRLDLVIGAVNYQFDLTRGRQTERVMRAMDNRYFSILGAPTGRLIEERRPYALDLVRVLRHAKERGCFMELNSRPARLDLDEKGCRLARAEGVLVCVNSATRNAAGFDSLRHGIGQARRGWLEKDDVLNTRPVAQVRALLARTMDA